MYRKPEGQLGVEPREVLLDGRLGDDKLSGEFANRRRLGKGVCGEQRPTEGDQSVTLPSRQITALSDWAVPGPNQRPPACKDSRTLRGASAAASAEADGRRMNRTGAAVQTRPSPNEASARRSDGGRNDR
jgi:hypothetical protein